MAQIYNIISIGAFSLAGVSLIFAIFCWIKFNIPRIVGALSGRTAKRSIEQMRVENEKTGTKSYRPTPIASNRGQLTESIAKNGQSKKKGKTKEIDTIQPPRDKDATSVLNYRDGETEILMHGTEVLRQSPIQAVVSQKVESFELVQDIVIIHTEEVVI